MKLSLIAAVVAAFAAGFSARQDPKEMQDAMEKAKKYTAPGKNHETLKKFLGSWTTEMRFFMGGKASPTEKGAAECAWLMDGRWIRSDTKGSMMGMPVHTHTIMGYDNFKQSFVATTVNSMDTAMIRVEGDLDQHGKTLIAYGTLDEYLDGQHDKAIKVVWRFESDDRFLMEVHDLAIGETNTKVFEIAYTRKK